jgi:hypothetical protein
LSSRQFDPVAVKAFMGHSKITTTERYLHARSRRTDAARRTGAFGGDAPEAPEHNRPRVGARRG